MIAAMRLIGYCSAAETTMNGVNGNPGGASAATPIAIPPYCSILRSTKATWRVFFFPLDDLLAHAARDEVGDITPIVDPIVAIRT